MKEKLLALMQNEGLRSSQLAEILDVNPAGISHILAGRNKPGFDLLQKILRRFPRVNPDWLLLDAPNMYRDQTDGTASSYQPKTPNPEREGYGNLFSTSETPASDMTGKSGTVGGTDPEIRSTKETTGVHPKSSIARIVIFYDDRTFESYSPENAMK